MYENEDTQLDISVYDGGMDEIVEGIYSENVHLQFEEAKKQIVAVERQGFYKIISVVTDDWIHVGGQPFLYFNYTFENGLDTKSSYLMLTGYDGNFLKVRLDGNCHRKENVINEIEHHGNPSRVYNCTGGRKLFFFRKNDMPFEKGSF